MYKIMVIVFRVALCACVSCAATSASATPSWFDPTEYFFSFSGAMGPGDIDRVTPSAHAILGGHEPGREWFAWATVDNPEVVLSAWEGYDPPQDLFLGFLGSDLISSPIVPGPAIGDVVRPDGGIYICVSDLGDEDCNRTGGFGGNSNYTFFLTLAPENAIPEPPTLVLLIGVLIALGGSLRLARKRAME